MKEEDIMINQLYYLVSKVQINTMKSTMYMLFTISVFLIIAGLISFFFPEFCWRLKLGWRAKDNSPSDSVIETYKILGVLGIIIGVILFIIAVVVLVRYLVVVF